MGLLTNMKQFVLAALLGATSAIKLSDAPDPMPSA